MDKNKYFNKPKATYVTRGVAEKILMSVQMLVWCVIEEAKTKVKPMDYLQVFNIKCNTSEQRLEIKHSQEAPDFFEEVMYMPFDTEIDEKIYVIDDIDHITMLLASEY